MTYLYTEKWAMDIPQALQQGNGINTRIRFEWAGFRRVRVSLGETVHILKLRDATEHDRRTAVNAAGWCYFRPSAA